MGRIDTCARCCIGLSVPGVIFLAVVGYMFDKQPLFTSTEIDDPSAASNNCYMAAVIYLVCIALSVAGIQYDKCNRGRGARLRDEPYGDEGAELLGSNDSGYGALSTLSQMPLMPQGYSRPS